MPSASNNPALTAMKDIQPPADIGAWPLAYGYWLLLALIIIAVIGLTIILIKHHRHRAAKREALMQLSQLDSTHPQLAIEVNALLKRSAMSYLPRQQVAALDGAAWHTWLQQQVNQFDNNLAQLLDKRYQPQPLTADEALQLKAAAAQWLKQALPLKQQNSRKEEPC
ncbi:DUF4381 domain-containing protein [Shewanella sp. Isolate11]|uniref:DUF4381 domain-containing protein n=1 Tax=Shewanella sp. Isolate11 TaxID=2908530 RepID=UPI001EFCF498|nr:DUF4381 domain-containing protein [Shewanella sp. Isolate11]MCG9696291.1 DUF4381 domain-containing protein [Shewanella sp. Isolate11]